jgi:hypothetical protein
MQSICGVLIGNRASGSITRAPTNASPQALSRHTPGESTPIGRLTLSRRSLLRSLQTSDLNQEPSEVLEPIFNVLYYTSGYALRNPRQH